MKILMEKLYKNIQDAKAFQISFTNFIYTYDDIAMIEYEETTCEHCGKSYQKKDLLVPKANCKKPCGILDSYDFGVSPELRDDLIRLFDITEKDFRPIRTKKGEIVYYQITPQHTMLPLKKENNWRARKPCPQCGSFYYSDSNFLNENGEDYFYISQEALDDMHGLNITYENFSRFYTPKVVISRRVYDYLVKRYPRTHYFPFFLK